MELALYGIESEMQRTIEDGAEIRFILGSVLNRAYLDMVMSDFEIDTVYHAAAYKHVPMVERNIIEGVRNNVIGTWRVAHAVAANEVHVFVMISTDKDATRYFMTSSEAAELVIQAGALAEGGEVFVLDMGELVKIQDLAEQMIHLHGKQVKTEAVDEQDADQFVDIVHIGLRPGEKLFEELIIGENVSGTRHPKILKADAPTTNVTPFPEKSEKTD